MSKDVATTGRQFPQEGMDYMTALLALWAGDDEAAKNRLQASTKGLSQVPRSALFTKNPTLASALRTLDQLNRRRTEYATLLEAAAVKPLDGPARMCVLASKGGHLSGVISSEGDGDFRLRAYLNDLRFEHVFYEVTFRRSQKGRSEDAGDLYRRRRDESVENTGAQTEPKLGHTWVQHGDLFVEVVVSDFCTLEAIGVWTAVELPRDAEEITAPFQKLLDELDGGDDSRVNWPREGF